MLSTKALEAFLGLDGDYGSLGVCAFIAADRAVPTGGRDAPRFIDYLDQVLPRHPELAPLNTLLQQRIKPALAAKAAA